MDLKKVISIADDCGISIGVFEQAKLTDTGNGTMKFIPSNKLTFFGDKLVMFANRIEHEALSKAVEK